MKSLALYGFALLLVSLLAVCAPSAGEYDGFGVRADPAYLQGRFQDVDEYSPDEDMNFAALNVATPATVSQDEGGKSVRGLVIEKPAIIPLGDRQKTHDGSQQDTRARSFIFNNMDRNQMSFLLYPYNFTYTPAETSGGVSASSGHSDNSDSSSASSSIYIEPDVKQTFPDGALLSNLDTENFPAHDYIKWIKATTDVDMKKAKAVYDVDIAILQIEKVYDEKTMDITYDSDRFCQMFYNQFYPKYRQCFNGYDKYLEYIEAHPTHRDEPIISFIHPQDIINGSLMTADGLPRFGVIFFPDVMFSELDYLTSALTPGKEQFKKFVNAGGIVSTTGKGAVLLELLDILPENTFDHHHSITSPNATTVFLDGCDSKNNGEPEDNSEAEFTKRTLCFSHHHVDNSKYIYGGFTSSPVFSDTPTNHGLTPILWLVHSTGKNRLLYHNEDSGLSSELPEGDIPRKYPALLYKKIGYGYAVVHMTNPAFSSWTGQYIYDTVFFAGARPIALDNTLSGGYNRTVPALEAVRMNIKLSLKNFFTTKVTNVKLVVYQRNGTVATAPSGFTKKDVTSVPNKVLDGTAFELDIGEVAETSNRDFNFAVKIIDPLVTQAGINIIVLYPVLTFLDARTGKIETLKVPVTVSAAMSALLRGDMNIDPSSTYPLPASGIYVDNVMNCENKEATEARRVQQISIIPLISPLIGISDQVKLAREIIFDKEYYKKDTNKIRPYVYPFVKGQNSSDFLDWDLLKSRHITLAANWDEGVKIFRETRGQYGLDPITEIFAPGDYIPRANYQTNNDDNMLILRQSQFYDSDKYYEHATQRMMAFLDLHDPEAARIYFNGDIPKVNQSASDSKVGKFRALFVRNDIFFWKKYPMPEGFTNANRNDFITVDHYEKMGTCGTPKGRTVQGEYHNDVGITSAEYVNVLAVSEQRCNNIIKSTEVEAKSNGKIRLIHYIVPVEPCDAKLPGDMLSFDPVTGFHEAYPEVVFERIMQAKFHINAEDSRRGGLMIFKFPSAPYNNMNAAIKAGNITFAADQIAIYEMFQNDKSGLELAVRFKRGMMPNEAYGRGSYLEMYLESSNLNLNEEVSVNMDMYDMTYDISRPQDNFEDWSVKTVSNQVVVFSVTGALRMPAVRMNFQLADKIEDSFMNPYELREPFVRIGIYEQEMMSHRAVYGADEFHPISEPSVVTDQGGFSTFTHVGTSSVPFREYVTTGESLRIPGSAETGRIEWDDIWGRHFVQNVRTTIFEYPPIPPPLRNFEMTTTFELLTKDGKRMMQWRSNQDMDVHVQLKMVNNYPKYFEITGCRANAVDQLCTGEHRCGVSRVFLDDPKFAAPRKDSDSGRQLMYQGHNSTYGICFRDPEVYLKGIKLTEDQRRRIQLMTHCAQYVGTENKTCEQISEGLPTLNKRGEADTMEIFNYATQVENFYPENYIKANMWDMTHYDYDDNMFDKAYKYHMDNRLPNINNGMTRPNNHIAFPLFKGLGYDMKYDKTYSNPAYPKYKGWWSDNLQNHDHTLFAQQEKSFDISVGKENQLTFFDHDEYEDASSRISSAEKNIYRCLFNRRRPLIYANKERGFFLYNVQENNIVPIIPEFNSTHEFNFKCNKTYFSPENISQVDNIIYTDTPRDWLYFASNLRGNSLEDLNIIYHLTPLPTEEVKYEGLAKVQDGGRFTYWNPANGPNSYLIVDNPVHTVLAMRNDLVLDQELIPTYTTTFDSNVYHHLSISDPAEIEREWELPIWTNNYGYGDFTVQVYVGDAGTTALPEPGTKLRIHYTFMNNAGFDIHMLKDAINSTLVSQEAINSYDLLNGLVTALREPNAYNFLNLTIPEEIKPYVSIAPCKDVVGIAPLFFDFDSINVVTIRDGWKGDYYYDLNVSENFPDHLRGRLNEIKVELVRKYFDNFPGVGDPTGIHDYTVEIPPIVFGVPYGPNSQWAGKVFYTSGYATNIHHKMGIRDIYTPEEAIFVEETDLEEFRACLGGSKDPDQEAANGEFSCLDKLWAKKIQELPHCEYTSEKPASSDVTYVDFAPGLAVRAPQFPVKVAAVDGPDIAVIHIMIRTHAAQVESGNPIITYGVTAEALDWTNNTVEAENLPYRTIHAKGAWLQLGWSMKLLTETGLELESELLTPEDSGLADITVTIKNTGDYYAYNVSFTLSIPVDVTPAVPGSGVAAAIPVPDGCTVGPNTTAPGETVFSCFVGRILVPGQPTGFLFRVKFKPDTRAGAGSKAKPPLNMHVMATSSRAQIDLTATAGEKTVVQDLKGPYGFKYTDKRDTNLAVLTAKRDSSYITLFKVSHVVKGVTYYIWRAKIPGQSAWTAIAVTKYNSLKENVKDRFESLGGSGTVKVDYVVDLTTVSTAPALNETVSVRAQSNIYEWRKTKSNLLLLLLLIPGLLVPAVIGAAVFALKKGSTAKPSDDLGMNYKEKFIPQEMPDEDDHFEAVEMDTSAPPPSLPQRPAPYEPPAPEPAEMAVSDKNYVLSGPTYVQSGRGVNVIDTQH